MATHEIHRALLVASFRRTIENHQRADEFFQSARVARIEIESSRLIVAEEDVVLPIGTEIETAPK